MIKRLVNLFKPCPAYLIEIKHNTELESAYSASGRVVYEGDERADNEVSRVRNVYGLCARKRLATEAEKQTAAVWL
jgi:hypothetical protein